MQNETTPDREKVLRRAKAYLDSWKAYPAKELGEQPTVFVHKLLEELYELAKEQK